MAVKIKAKIKETEGKPGRYESIFENHPGFIQFPVPFMYPHFREWWQKVFEPLQNAGKLDFANIDLEWEGAKHLIIKYGKWGIESVSVGEFEKGNVPTELVSFVRMAADDFIWPYLSPKELRLLNTRA